MDGPAEHVFDGSIPDAEAVAAARGQAAETEMELPAVEPSLAPADSGDQIDCATVCAKGCIRPENCPSEAARAKVAALLNSTSLDDLVTLATNSLESRTRARFEREG